MHIDNAPAHKSKMTQNFYWYDLLNRPPYPPYFPDLSSSDFYLLRKVKDVLIRREISDEIDLLEAPTEILNGISSAELHRGLRSWIHRVGKQKNIHKTTVRWLRQSFCLLADVVLPHGIFIHSIVFIF
jgi:hypothetical protein